MADSFCVNRLVRIKTINFSSLSGAFEKPQGNLLKTHAENKSPAFKKRMDVTVYNGFYSCARSVSDKKRGQKGDKSRIDDSAREHRSGLPRQCKPYDHAPADRKGGFLKAGNKTGAPKIEREIE